MNPIESFLAKFDNPRTYKSCLNLFFKVIKCDIDKYFDGKRTDKEFENDVLKFKKHYSDKTPKTIKTYIACVKSFLEDNDIELRKKFWKDIQRRTKGTYPVTDDIIPTREQLREILQHGSIKARALYLMMASSGLRIGELTGLELDDVDRDSNPVRIRVRGELTRSGNPRVTFISKEAKNSLESWLKERNEYLRLAIRKAEAFKIKKSPIDNRIFPMDTNNCRNIWNRLLIKSGFSSKDKTTGWERIHPHCIRKFWRSNLEMPVDMVEEIMGHSGYLTKEYRKIPEKKLAKAYLKAEPSITIFEREIDEEKLQQMDAEIKRRDDKLKSQSDDIEFLKRKLVESENELKRLGNDFVELGSAFDFVAKKVEKQEKEK